MKQLITGRRAQKRAAEQAVPARACDAEDVIRRALDAANLFLELCRGASACRAPPPGHCASLRQTRREGGRHQVRAPLRCFKQVASKKVRNQQAGASGSYRDLDLPIAGGSEISMALRHEGSDGRPPLPTGSQSRPPRKAKAAMVRDPWMCAIVGPPIFSSSLFLTCLAGPLPVCGSGLPLACTCSFPSVAQQAGHKHAMKGMLERKNQHRGRIDSTPCANMRWSKLRPKLLATRRSSKAGAGAPTNSKPASLAVVDVHLEEKSQEAVCSVCAFAGVLVAGLGGCGEGVPKVKPVGEGVRR